MASLDWNLILLFAIADLLILYVFFRVERKARWIVIIFLTGPVCFLMYRLAGIRDHMAELFTALGLACLLFTSWYIAYGRHLPIPTSDNIKVWTPDDTETRS